MAVIRANEVSLNGKYYKINGLVRPSLASVWPNKLVVGDYTLADELVASSWIISDQRGGCLIEEMEEDIHRDKFYWSTCNTDYKGHIILPPLATEVTLPTLVAPTIVNADMELTTGWTNSARSDTQKHGGTYSWALLNTNTDAYQDLATTQIQGRRFTVTGWIYQATANVAHIGISDGSTTWSADSATINSWVEVTVTKTLSQNATRLRIYLQGTASYNLYYDDISIARNAYGYPVVACNFNSETYWGFSGGLVAKVNSTTGATIDGVYEFGNAITDLIRSVNSCLYVFFGDSVNYQYMSTAEAFTETDVQDANKGIQWDSKLFKINTTGQLAYAATPNAASPSWTNNGNLADEGLVANDIQELSIYRDANANPIIYAGTKIGLYAHDYTNAKWVQTELSLPNHPTCGAGLAWWRDALYLSAGLNVYEYIAGTIAYIASMGLDSSDGLPNKYVGEIAKLIEGYDNFFALVDASLTSGTGYSSMFVYNGGAWRCRWVDAAADQAMRCGIVSSVFAYRFWWAIASKIYYIALERSLRNPLKISTYPYGVAAVHITPRFDGANPWNKVALRVKAICDKMDAGNEEIVVKYRINAKCYEGIDAANTWTTLVTLDTDGETSTDFGSSAGITFKVIQFRFDLSRGSTNTKTPDLQRVTLVYERTTPAAWAWNVEIDLTQPYRGQTPEQMWQNLKAIITGGVLVPFIFTHEDGSAETNYVEIRGLEGTASTGEEKVGTYQLRLVAP